MYKKIFLIMSLTFVIACCIACGNSSNSNIVSNEVGSAWQTPDEYVGIYDGEDGGILQFDQNGKGKYIEKGWKEWDNLKWEVNVKKNYIWFELQGPNSHSAAQADVSNFQNTLIFEASDGYWQTEKYTKRK